MILLIIRHGESEADILHVHEGRADFELTERGHEQAAAMARYVAGQYPLTRIYASPLKRAAQTARHLAQASGLEICFEPDLMEFNNGLLAGLSFEEADRLYPRVENLPPDQAVYGQETKNEFRRRGERVLERVLSENDADGVVALVRRADGIRMEGPWEVREGLPLDYDALKAAAAGCDAVINCAGVTDMSLRHYEDYLPVNRELCRLLVGLLEDLEIKTLVHASTVNTIGYGTVYASADEQSPMEKPFLGSYYADSKREGEEVLLEAAKRLEDRHIVIVNPGYLLGPWDVKPSSGRMLLAAYKKRIMFAPDGGKAFVHVQDVAAAMVGALTRGRNGQRYIAANRRGCMTIKELYQLQAEIYGDRQWVLTAPDWLLRVGGWLGDALRAAGVRTQVSTRNVKQLMVHEFYNGTLAATELGMPESSIADAIKDFHQWRKENPRK